MTNLVPVSSLTPVPQLETTDAATGGPAGTMNLQAQALLNRLQYLTDNPPGGGGGGGGGVFRTHDSGDGAFVVTSAMDGDVIEFTGGYLNFSFADGLPAGFKVSFLIGPGGPELHGNMGTDARVNGSGPYVYIPIPPEADEPYRARFILFTKHTALPDPPDGITSHWIAVDHVIAAVNTET